MKAFREILFTLVAAALGYFIGASGEKARDLLPTKNSDRPENGSHTASAATASADDTLAPVLSALLTRGDLRVLATLGPMLDALDDAQFPALFEKLDRLPEAEIEHLLPRLLAYWTKRDPHAATAWMEPRLARYAKDPDAINGFFHFVTNLMDAWVENAPEVAVEYARQHPWSGLTQHILHVASPAGGSASKFALLQTFPPGRERAKLVTAFFFVWAQGDRAAALAAATSLPPGPEREGGLGEILARWAGRKPAEAFAKAEALGIVEPAILAIMAKEGARSDPLATARWLEKQDAALLPQIGGVVVKFWAEKNPAAAFDWALAHGISPLDEAAPGARNFSKALTIGHGSEMSGNPFTSALREKPDETLAWVRALPAGDMRERYLESAIHNRLDPAKAQPLLAELPPEAAARAARSIAAQLSRDIEQASQWAATLPAGPVREGAWAALGASRTEPLALPPGPDRDAMLRGIASRRAESEPVKSLERALEIGDPALRRRTFDDVFWLLHRGPTDLGHGSSMGGASESARRAAAEWLESAKVPEDWKQSWR